LIIIDHAVIEVGTVQVGLTGAKRRDSITREKSVNKTDSTYRKTMSEIALNAPD
jgi:hypothetical protein